jgi:4-amino-4-deoxy-L-arabinose transferase-like glycosyltransferase
VPNQTAVIRAGATPVALPDLFVVALGVAVALFVFSLGGPHDFSHIDEHRYAEISRVMAAPGGDWLVPHLNRAIYHDKPPLFFWIAALAQRFGIALPAAAIVPSQLGAAAALLATFGIARRIAGVPAALVSVVLLGTGVRFASLASRANLDALLTGFVAVSLYAFVRGEASGERVASRLWYVSACLAAGLGVLVKGPVAIAIPAVTVAVSRVLEGRAKSLLSVVVPAGVALALLPISVWLLAAEQHVGWDYVSRIVVHHGVEHALGRVAHPGGLWDYLRIFPAAFLPGTLLLPAAVATLPRRWPLDRSDAFPLAWFCGGFVLLSLFPVKRHHYLMPIYPGAALFVARIATSEGERMLRERRAVRALVAVGGYAMAAIGAAFGAALVWAASCVWLGVDPSGSFGATRAARIWPLVAAAPTATLDIGVALGIAAAGGALLAWRASSIRVRAISLAAIALAVTLVRMRVVEPIVEAGSEKRAFLESAAAVVGTDPVADYGGMHFAANWVLRRDDVPLLGDVEAATRFLAEHEPARGFLLADRDNLEHKGIPPGVQVRLVWPRALGPDLVVLGPDRR